MKIVSWNINKQVGCYTTLLESGVDIALLQEAVAPPKGVSVNPGDFVTAGPKRRRWRAAIALLDHAEVDWIDAEPSAQATGGTLALARVRAHDELITVASMYGAWEREGSQDWADKSVHRIIDDLAAHVRRGESVIAAGDLNTLYGYGELGRQRYAIRHAAVFKAFEDAGLVYCGPRFPFGLKALTSGPNNELPRDSLNVPTYRRNNQKDLAVRQLDFVFATLDLVSRLAVRALNGDDEWGDSDHCRIEIELKAA